MYVDYEALEGLRRPTVVSVGDNYRDEVERWDSFYDFPFVVRSRPYKFTDDKPTGWSDELDEVMETIAERIEELRKKNLAEVGSELQQSKREQERYDLELRLAEMAKQRKPLSEWEFREIARCLIGHGTTTGIHYDYLNHGTIEEISEDGYGGGDIRPVYRSADDWIFRAFQQVQEEKTGMVGGKRRRFGFSWISVQDDVYDASFKEGTTFFVTKDDDDFKKYFKRIEFMMSRRPKFLRPDILTMSLSDKTIQCVSNAKVRAVKEKFGLVKKGRTPRPFSFRAGLPRFISTLAGDTISKVKIDEIGEIGNIMDVWQIISPSLLKSNSLERGGCFIGLGTVGSMDAAGMGFKKFFAGHATFKLHKVMIPGWMGIDVDPNGNSDRVAISAKIRQTVKMYEKTGFHTLAIVERQKFPLDEEDMFLQDNSKIIMPQHILEMMSGRREEHAPDHNLVFGVFARVGGSRNIQFIEQEPNPPKDLSDPTQARHIGYKQWVFVKNEHYNKFAHIKNAYVAGCDPIDMDNDLEKAGRNNRSFLKHSDITCLIYKREAEVGGQGQMPIGLYCSRSDDLDDEYEQIALALTYFRSKVNIERQKGGRMYAWFKKHGFTDCIAYAVDMASLDKRNGNQWGYSADAGTWTTHISLAKEDLKKNHEKFEFDRLIDELYKVKQDNTDAVVAYFAALHFASELDVREEQNGKDIVESASAVRVPEFIRDGNGRVIPKSLTTGSNMGPHAGTRSYTQYDRAAQIKQRQMMLRNGRRK